MGRILLAEDKDSLARMLKEALESEHFSVDVASTGTDAIRRFSDGRRYAAVLTDLKLPGQDGLAVLRSIREMDPDCPVIVMTAYGTIENAVEAMKIGAFDFVQKPVDLDYLTILLRRAEEQRALKFENLLLKEEFQKERDLPAIVGDSPLMLDVSRLIQKVAPTDATVLLQGESGTGKELFARAVHRLSTRKNRPFVAVNCAAIPDTLIENELFGHEKGAYTGAVSRQLGRFELADGGTLFLDEIGELGFSVQSKILRVLQEHSFERIGGATPIEVDVRVICATNRDLQREVKAGRFRDDLFFRINVVSITIPPLRQRREDIEPLVRHFLAKYGRELGKPDVRISDVALAALASYDWPGNIRELENSIERAVIVCEKRTVETDDLHLRSAGAEADEKMREAVDLSGSIGDATQRAIAAVERLKIADALRHSASKAEAAQTLGISYRTLLTKMREHGFSDSEGVE